MSRCSGMPGTKVFAYPSFRLRSSVKTPIDHYGGHGNQNDHNKQGEQDNCAKHKPYA